MKQIRLWKLGYIDNTNVLNSILPTKAMVEKLKTILKDGMSGQEDKTLDIIWGPDINVELVEIEEGVENYIVGQDGKLEKI